MECKGCRKAPFLLEFMDGLVKIIAMNESSQSSAAPPRYQVLDGLRAIAILLVIMMHSLRESRTDEPNQILPLLSFDLSSFAYNGWIGVYLFFVLSGFLIGKQLISISDLPATPYRQSLLRYFKVRFFRIAPAYYVTLPLLAIFQYVTLGHAETTSLGDYFSQHTNRLIVHLFFMHDYIPPPLAAYLWSLAVEIKFYIAAPFLMLLLFRLKTTKGRVIGLLSLATVLIFVRIITVLTIPETYHGHDSYFFLVQSRFHLTLDCLLAGMACALFWGDGKIRALIMVPVVANTLFFTGLFILIAVAGINCIVYPLNTPAEQIFIPTKLAICFSMIMLGLLGQCKGYKFFENRVFGFIALISYSLYLTHGFCLWAQNEATQKLAQVELAQNAPLIYWLMTLPVFLVLSMLLATILYKLVEKPFIDWSKI